MEVVKTFKRTAINIFKNLLYTLFSPVVMYILVVIVLKLFNVDSKTSEWIGIGLSALVFLALLKMLIVDDRITVTVCKDGLLYKSGSKETFYDYDQYQFGYKSVTTDGITDTINLYVYQEGEYYTLLNCEPLGLRQFQEMYSYLKENTVEEQIQSVNIVKNNHKHR